MGYSDFTEFPRGHFYTDLTSATVAVTADPIRVASVLVTNTDSVSRGVQIRDGAGAVRCTLFVPPGGTKCLYGEFYSDGLDVRDSAGAARATSHVTVVYYDD